MPAFLLSLANRNDIKLLYNIKMPSILISTVLPAYRKEKCVNGQIREILFVSIFIPKSSVLPINGQINAVFFVSVYRGFLGVVRKNAGLLNYNLRGYN